MYVLGVDAGFVCTFLDAWAHLDALCILMDHQSFYISDSTAVNTVIFRLIFEARMASSIQTNSSYSSGSTRVLAHSHRLQQKRYAGRTPIQVELRAQRHPANTKRTGAIPIAAVLATCPLNVRLRRDCN